MPWHPISDLGAGRPFARFDMSSSTLTTLRKTFLMRLRLESAPGSVVRAVVISRAGAPSWRVSRFTCDTVESLEKHLARKLGTDPAATACTQVTRLPEFANHKRTTPYVVSIEYRNRDRVYEPADFPKPPPLTTPPPTLVARTAKKALDRARQYVAAIPPAISGQHGDVHTFRVCCRVVRGFALADDEALDVLREWNSLRAALFRA